jgi:beta-lactamase regulating signal transducer with metallopeptidase domain
VIGWAIEAMIASAVLMAIVLVIRAPVRRHFGPGIAYALWALPAIRLVLPPLPRFTAWHNTPAPQIAQRAGETLTVYVIEPLAGSAAAPTSLYSSIGLALAVMWVVGAVAFLFWHAINHVAFCRRMIASSTSSALEGDIEVIETDAASGPLAFGIFRRYVAFPPDFAERYDDEERELALAHELGHHARGDVVSNWIALVVLALHWFNPLAWRAFRAFRADQEMANDARVLAGRPAIDRHTYACAIVKAAHGGAVSAACHLHTIHDLKGRLRMLTTGRRSRLRLTLGGTAVAALMLAGLAGTASGTAAASTVRAGVEKATGLDLATLDAKLAMKMQSVPVVPPGGSVDVPVVPPGGSVAVPVEPPAAPEEADLPPPPSMPRAPTTTTTTTTESTTTASSDDRGTMVATDGPDGKRHVKRVKIVHLGKNGEVMNEDFRDIADIPEIRSDKCGWSGKGAVAGQNVVINKVKSSGQRVVIICNDRIQAISENAVAAATRANAAYIGGKDYQRLAYAKALEGVRAAREGIAANSSLSADAKREALAGIDESIEELKADMAKDD